MGCLLLASGQSCVCKPYTRIPATIARIAVSAQTVTEKSLKSRQQALNKLTLGPSSLLVKALCKTLFPSAMCRRFTMILACTESCEVIASISDTDLVITSLHCVELREPAHCCLLQAVLRSLLSFTLLRSHSYVSYVKSRNLLHDIYHKKKTGLSPCFGPPLS